MKPVKSFDQGFYTRQHNRILLWSVTLMLASASTFAIGYEQGGDSPQTPSQASGAQSIGQTITPIPFGEMNGDDVYNASGVVPLTDSRFLFCDNTSNDALFELALTADGQKKGPLIRHTLQGLAPNAIDDMEAMTLAEDDGRRFIFVTSSLFVKKTKDGQSLRVPPSGLLRVRVNSDDSLSAENMPDFREWFIQQSPAIAASANLIPDEGGLNIEGLAWDHDRHALLFGVRTPLSGNDPLVIPVRVKKLDGPWTTANLKMLSPIRLALVATEGARGIRSIEYVASRHAFLVVVGKTVSGGKAPYGLYEWKGGRRGKMHRLNVSFAGKMKPEGVTSGSVAGKPVLLFVDDGGGYQALWLDKTKL